MGAQRQELISLQTQYSAFPRAQINVQGFLSDAVFFRFFFRRSEPIPSGLGRACEAGAGQLSPAARLRRPPACDHHTLSTQATHPSGVATLKLNKAELVLLHRPPPSPSQASPASGLS